MKANVVLRSMEINSFMQISRRDAKDESKRVFENIYKNTHYNIENENRYKLSCINDLKIKVV